MQQKELIIENPRGLHMRVAAEIVRLSRESGVQVRLTRDGEKSACGDSVIELVLLDAAPGAVLKIEVTGGGNEQHVVARISDLFADGAGI